MKTLKILIIEDNPSDTELLTENIKAFHNLKCAVTAAENVKEGILKLDTADYDVVFLDLNLPDSSGFNTVAAVNEKKKRAALIIMSGVGIQETIAKSLNIGAQNFIIKGEETPASLERAVLFSVEREKNIEEIKNTRKIIETEALFFSGFHSDMVRAKDETEIYGIIARRINELIKNSVVLVSVLDPTGEFFSIAAYSGLAGPVDKIAKMLKMDPTKTTYALKDMTGEEIKLFRSGRLELLPGGIHALSARKFPKIAAEAVEKMMNINFIHTVGFVSGERHFGGVTILSSNDIQEYRDVLERAVQYSAVIIKRKLAENALIESEEKFRAAFEQVSVGVSYTAIDGTLISVNNRLCEIIGYTREEAEKIRFQDISFPEEAARDLEAIKKLKQGTISLYNTEKRYRRKDGSIAWVNLTSSPVRDPDNNIKYLISVIQDISGRKRTEFETDFYNAVQDEVSRVDTTQEIFTIVADKVREFLGGCITLVTYLDVQASGFRISAHSGLPDLVDKVIGIIGVDPRKILYKLSEIPEHYLAPFRTGKLVLLEKGVYAMALGTIPEPLCAAAQKVLKSEFVYVIGFVSDKEHFGSLDIISTKNIEEHRGVIERVIQHATVVIKKKVAEENLKSSEEKWAAFTDAAEDNLMLWDNELNLVAANASAKKVFKEITGKDFLAGKPMHELMGYLKSSGRYEKFLEVIRTGRPFSVPEYSINAGGGETRYFSLNAFKVGTGMGLITTDITELKRSEIILKQSYEKLKDVDRLKSNFISIISHELRTPLTIIKGFTSFLTREAAGPLNENQKNFVNTIEMNTSRLSRIINDMVDMSKIESGMFVVERERKDLAGIINEAAGSMYHIAEENGINLVAEIEPDTAYAEVDKGRIIQAITNFVNNAVRFTKKGGTIKIGLKNASRADMPAGAADKMKEEKNYYYINVSDDGAGIEKNQLEKIFERFYQVENANTRKHQGAGLGLSIAKNIVEAHHGHIWAESDGHGKGTKICMVLPE